MKMISGIQATLIGSFTAKEMIALLESKEAYLVATVEGIEWFRIPLINLPTLNLDEWYEIGPQFLPVEKTRFDCPAWAMLRYRLAPELAQKR